MRRLNRCLIETTWFGHKAPRLIRVSAQFVAGMPLLMGYIQSDGLMLKAASYIKKKGGPTHQASLGAARKRTPLLVGKYIRLGGQCYRVLMKSSAASSFERACDPMNWE